ncbi:MAG: hypothetical protein NC912_06265 [Candidatus Omnitrophica bacterium]|nr:hypothetical protein [Candidatus Omnitrophota bacterium]
MTDKDWIEDFLFSSTESDAKAKIFIMLPQYNNVIFLQSRRLKQGRSLS